MSPSVTLPHSIDLEQHLTADTKGRAASGLKAMGALLADGTVVSLAGGMPHQSLFPLTHAKFTIPAPQTLGSVDSWVSGEAETSEFELFKGREGGAIDLAQGMQYGWSNGFEQLLDPIAEMMQLVHSPPYADATTVLTLGATDGVAKTWMLFCDKGDNVLCEDFTFMASLNSGRARGINFHGVDCDTDGLIPEALDRTLTEWDVAVKGKRPHLLYTIPCGQNPTGTCLSEERYQAIYALARKHDLIIMEDDPYFWLQFQPYTADKVAREAGHAQHQLPPAVVNPLEDDLRAVAEPFNAYANVRSFLSRDVDGRVTRLDTFSKMFAPGMRMGWITCNASFAERYLRVGETNTQVPNGIGQSILASYLSPVHGWGIGGFLRWIFGVRREYERKRDFFLDTMAQTCNPEYISASPPLGGMFVFVKIAIEKHPRYVCAEEQPTSGPRSNAQELMKELFDYCLAKKVLLIPGHSCAAFVPGLPNVKGVDHILDRCNYFRATFAGDVATIDKALHIFGPAVDAWFQGDGLP